MADCAMNVNNTIHKLSIGNKVANYIFIYEHDVKVVRQGTELPDIAFESINNTASTTRYLKKTTALYYCRYFKYLFYSDTADRNICL